MKTKLTKINLLVVLKENRAKHQNTYNEALVGYREKLLEILNKMIVDIKDEKLTSHTIDLIIPKSYVKSYDECIKMLEFSSPFGDIELDESDFRHFVLDNWEWSREFSYSNSTYLKK